MSLDRQQSSDNKAMNKATKVLPARVGVYGGGRMGAGIAHIFLLAGSEVVVVEATRDSADAARARIEESIVEAEKRGTLTDGASAGVLSRLIVSRKANDLVGCELVIEAVPEDVCLKQKVLVEVEQVAPSIALATNTSSLSVTSLASSLSLPERFIGLHFFNPVPTSKLVEIVKGERTEPDLIAAARQWVALLGKTAVIVKDSPGFASSRLGVAIALEAMRMLEEGVASAEDIDTAMMLGYRHPIGPLKTTDIVGLDVRLAIAEHLTREIGSRFEPPTILRQKVAAGELGRKTGQGFYSW